MAIARISSRRRVALTVAATISAVTLAVSACSSSGGGGKSKGPSTGAASGSGSSTGGSSSGVAAANQANTAQATLPTKISITTALSKKPPSGKKVFFLSLQSGDFSRWTSGFKTAAAALGWTPTVLYISPTGSPADFNGLVQQAIQQGAQYIAVAGPVFPTNNAMVATARAAKVPLFYFSTSQVPQGASNWNFAAVGATQEYSARGKLFADQVIAATNGKAKALILNTPQFPVFQVLATAFKAELAANCPGCTANFLDVPITDVLAGKSGSAVIAYLRSHPDVNVFGCNTSNFCQDVPAKAKAAGITVGKGGIPVVLAALGDGQLSWVADGTAVSGQGTPYEYVGWQLIDAMARYSVGDSIEPNWKAVLPEYLYTATNSPSGTKPYQGPTDYQAQFKALWKV